MYVNHNIAASFHLTTTIKQHSTPSERDSDNLTTITDYVKNYPSTLQTTSCNFAPTKTTGEICVGVLKALNGIHSKNSCRYSMDIQILEKQQELETAFVNPITKVIKAIDNIQVNWASNEGPTQNKVWFD